jgi:hypothetical protein
MGEKLFYSSIFLLIGVLAISIASGARKSKDDPYLVKINGYSLGILMLLLAFYLILKTLL